MKIPAEGEVQLQALLTSAPDESDSADSGSSHFIPCTKSCLRHYARSWKVAVSIADEVLGFFQFQLHYGPGVDSASNRNEYQESSSSWREVVA
jgi:hypothetical protein